jgi:hypothetical protein
MMRKIAIALLMTMFALPLTAADERMEKRRLLAELLEVIDSRAMVQSTLDQLLDASEAEDLQAPEQVAPEQRAEWEEMARTRRAELRAWRAKLYTRLDYTKLADTVFTPMFDERFSAAELQALIDFAKTSAGHKLMQLVPQLGFSALHKGREVITAAQESVQDEVEKEMKEKYPSRTTMSDLRMLATATEARATDTNDYPQVLTIDELEPLLTPTYIRTVPKTDAWGTPFLYVSDGVHYRFASAGADKRFDWNARHLDPNAQPKEVESADADIIFQDGQFIQYPKESGLKQP